MKNKIIISILTIFVIGACLAAVYAEEAHVGSLNFDVPSGFTISESTGSNVILNSSSKDIIITTEYADQAAVTKYLGAKGFKYTTSMSGNSTVTGRDGSSGGSYSFVGYSFAKGSEKATAYILNKDGIDFSVIVIDRSSTGSSLIMDTDVSSILKDIMLG